MSQIEDKKDLGNYKASLISVRFSDSPTDLPKIIEQTMNYMGKTISQLNPYDDLKNKLGTLQALVSKCLDERKNDHPEFNHFANSVKEECRNCIEICKKYIACKFPSYFCKLTYKILDSQRNKLKKICLKQFSVL